MKYLARYGLATASLLVLGFTAQIAEARRGADDGPGHVRQCRSCDDGPNHDANDDRVTGVDDSRSGDTSSNNRRRGRDDAAHDGGRGRGRGENAGRGRGRGDNAGRGRGRGRGRGGDDATPES